MSNEAKTAWLNEAVKAIRSSILPKAALNITVKYGLSGDRGKDVTLPAECWTRDVEGKTKAVIFISKNAWIGAVPVMDLLCHEMIHTYITGAGHGKAFAAEATAIGLIGDPKSTRAGPALYDRLTEMAAKLPQFPDAIIPPPAAPEADETKGASFLYRCAECRLTLRATIDSLVASCAGYGDGDTLHLMADFELVKADA